MEQLLTQATSEQPSTRTKSPFQLPPEPQQASSQSHPSVAREAAVHAPTLGIEVVEGPLPDRAATMTREPDIAAVLETQIRFAGLLPLPLDPEREVSGQERGVDDGGAVGEVEALAVWIGADRIGDAPVRRRHDPHLDVPVLVLPLLDVHAARFVLQDWPALWKGVGRGEEGEKEEEVCQEHLDKSKLWGRLVRTGGVDVQLVVGCGLRDDPGRDE